MFVLEALNIFLVLELFLFLGLGLILGSFASALIHRIPQNIPVFSFSARSACVHCQHALSAWDLLPVFSWCLLRGRCRYCQENLPILYPVLEFSSAIAALSVAVVYREAGMLNVLLLTFTLPILLSLFVIDLKYKVLPNVLMLILFGFGIVKAALFLAHAGVGQGWPLAVEYAGGCLVYGFVALVLKLSMDKALKKPSLGMGDVKFFAVAGLWLGLSNLAFFYVLSGVLGIVFGALWQKIRREAVFPFGPALIIAFFFILMAT